MEGFWSVGLGSSHNFPKIISLPTVYYFFWEKPLVKSTAPGLSFIIFTFKIYFCSILFSDLLTQKPENTLLHFSFIYLILLYCEIYLSNLLQNKSIFYPGGIDNPSFTSGCKYLSFVCRYHLNSVVWSSYWFDNLGLITKGNTYRAVLHHPFLFREIPT